MIETVKATGTVEPPERAKSALIADTFWDMEKNLQSLRMLGCKRGTSGLIIN